MKHLTIFDLDGTVINSDHRLKMATDKNLSMDNFCVETYRKTQVWEHVKNDLLLPLADLMREQIALGYNVGIVTARQMRLADWQYLSKHNLLPLNDALIYHREKMPNPLEQNNAAYKMPVLKHLASQAEKITFYEDDRGVIEAAKTIDNINVVDAVHFNKTLNNVSQWNH